MRPAFRRYSLSWAITMDAVDGLKADAVDFHTEPVGILTDRFFCIGTIFSGNALGECGRNAVGLQKDHGIAQIHALMIAFRHHFPALFPKPADFLQALGML